MGQHKMICLVSRSIYFKTVTSTLKRGLIFAQTVAQAQLMEACERPVEPFNVPVFEAESVNFKHVVALSQVPLISV